MRALATGYGLIEGPVWDAARRRLCFSDVPNGGVFALGQDGTVETVIPHRRGIGGMALHVDGGLVVGGRNIAFKSFDGARSVVLLDDSVTEEAIAFNDLKTDGAGRIYVGSIAFRVFAGDAIKPGHLHMIDLDGSVQTVSGGVKLSNGLGFSPDGRRLYHCDARDDLVRVYDIASDGTAGPWRPFTRIGRPATPDGLAVAADGSVWVAIAHGGQVRVYEPDGRERARLAVPLPLVTSLCFGGEDLRDLYVVTGSHGGPHPDCGTVFVTRTDVAGAPVAPCRVALPAS